jgi:hypothetical protein
LAIDPSFALSGAVGGADADVIADGILIDFKTGKGRSLVSAKEIYQLIGYALLDIDDRYKITGVGIHALRWRTCSRRSVGTVAVNAGSQAATTSRSIRGAYVPVRAAEFIFARW